MCGERSCPVSCADEVVYPYISNAMDAFFLFRVLV